MKLLPILIIFIFCQSEYSKPNSEKLVQMSIDFPVLQNHISKQEIMNTSRVMFIMGNDIIDTTMHLKYNGQSLKYNNGKGAEGFHRFWTFEFLEIKVLSTKAIIEYKYYPHWNYCQGKSTLSQSGSLYYKVKLKYAKKGSEWNMEEYDIEDVNFETEIDSDNVKCLKSKYEIIKKNN